VAEPRKQGTRGFYADRGRNHHYNGTKLTDNESMVVRMALATFADILADGLGFKDDGIPLTDRYQADIAHVRKRDAGLFLVDGCAKFWT